VFRQQFIRHHARVMGARPCAGLFGGRVVEPVNFVGRDCAPCGFDQAGYPEDSFERMPMGMEDGRLRLLITEKQFPWSVGEPINNAKVARLARRSIAKLEQYHWFVFKALYVRKLRFQQVIGVVRNGRRVRLADIKDYGRGAAAIVNQVHLTAAVRNERCEHIGDIPDRATIQRSRRGAKMQDAFHRIVQDWQKWRDAIPVLVQVVYKVPKLNEFGNHASGSYLLDEQSGLCIDPAVIGDEALKLITKRGQRLRQIEKIYRSFILIFKNKRSLFHAAPQSGTISRVIGNESKYSSNSGDGISENATPYGTEYYRAFNHLTLGTNICVKSTASFFKQCIGHHARVIRKGDESGEIEVERDVLPAVTVSHLNLHELRPVFALTVAKVDGPFGIDGDRFHDAARPSHLSGDIALRSHSGKGGCA
jgi:hypothetical protein